MQHEGYPGAGTARRGPGPSVFAETVSKDTTASQCLDADDRNAGRTMEPLHQV
jgi:hypothetical protein